MSNYCSRCLFASIIAIFSVIFLTVAHAGPLQVELEAGDSTDTVRVNLTNSGTVPLTVLRWDTPFESTLSSDVFRIERSIKKWPLSEAADYIGREIKRADANSSHFILLQPGASVSTQVALNEHYHIEATGFYTVVFDGDIHYSESSAPSDGDSQNQKVEFLNKLESVPVQSGRVIVSLSPKPLNVLNPTARVLPPVYESCSVEQQTAIDAAAVVAEQMVNTATSDLNGLAVDERIASPRYNTWFGTYSETRFNQVVSHYQLIGQALATETIRYDCSCTDEGVFAYVYPSRPYNIFLCPAFDRANIDGTDSRAGTIIHELSHFTVLGGTDDHAYGQQAVQALASSNPNRAVGNADSIEYFAENTPELAIRYDGIRPDPREFIQLELSTPVTGEVAQGETINYEVTGASNVSLESLSGDADMTIYGDESLFGEICTSTSSSALDACDIFQTGRIFVQVVGYSAATFTLEATAEPTSVEPVIDPVVLALESPVTGLLLHRERVVYEVEGASLIELESISGDADLYVFNSLNFESSNLICSSAFVPSASTIDSCDVPADAGRIYVLAVGYSASEYSLVARVVAGTDSESTITDQGQLIPDDVVQRGILRGEYHTYTVTDVQTVRLTSISGDADLFVSLTTSVDRADAYCVSELSSAVDECETIPDTDYQVAVFGFSDARYTLLSIPADSIDDPVDADGFVFSRTDKTEFRWVIGNTNVWITSECAVSLGGATQSGTWSDLNAVAPGFDEAANPCDGVTLPDTGEGTPPVMADGYVFSRTDKTEFRWVVGSDNVWITSECAASLGGATETGTWSDLNAVAPGFDQAANPCDGVTLPDTGEGTPPVTTDGYVFSRTDKTEFRWVLGSDNVWITSECAASLGGATESGTWSDLNAVAPGFDQAANPCDGVTPPDSGSDSGFVFSRDDKNEFRWVIGSENIWITESCAIALGGATVFGGWSDLNALAPGFDQAEDPCVGL